MMTTYSLNLMAYLRDKGFNIEVKTDNGYKFYAIFEPTKEVLDAIYAYKKDKELHLFLQAYKELRKEINEMRTSNL